MNKDALPSAADDYLRALSDLRWELGRVYGTGWTNPPPSPAPR